MTLLFLALPKAIEFFGRFFTGLTPDTHDKRAPSRSDVLEMKVEVTKWEWHSTSASVGEVSVVSRAWGVLARADPF